MYTKTVFVVCLLAVLFKRAALQCETAGPCTASNCKREDGCACSSTVPPISKDRNPLFVTITIDDSVSLLSYNDYYSKLLFDRTNSDGTPIGATFYVPHPYSDYTLVNKLYNLGYDIGVNSISKGSQVYFRDASADQLYAEFNGQKEIIAELANIPTEDIKGARTPHLELAGNKTFEAYVRAGLEYDNSWTAFSWNRFQPYTLDTRSNQPELIGSTPTCSFPGFWILPINNLNSTDGLQCNALTTCGINLTAPEITNYFVKQFEVNAVQEQAPATYLLSTSWFNLNAHALEGFVGFLNYLKGRKDTFVVSHKELVRWSKNPVQLGSYTPSWRSHNAQCLEFTCPLEFNGEIRILKTCSPCPDEYPWVTNT